MLAEYQKEENQDFLLKQLDSVFYFKTNRENRRFVEHSVKYDYPKGSIDRFLKFYEELKATDSHFIHKHSYLNYAKNNTPIRNKLMTALLLDAANSSDERKKEIFERISSLLWKVPDSEMIDFRIEFWKNGGRLKCSSFRHINSKYPELAFSIAKTELGKLENDNYNRKHYYNCYRKFIGNVADNNISPEKYINWTLKSSNQDLQNLALAMLCEYSYHSSKKLVFGLMESDSTPMRYRRIIDAVLHFELNESEKEQIQRWVNPYRIMEKTSKYPYPIEENLEKIGIK